MRLPGNLDLGLGEFLQARAENLGALPAAGNPGRLVFRTSDNTLHLDTGASFIEVNAAVLSRLSVFNGAPGLLVGQPVNVPVDDTVILADASAGPAGAAIGVIIAVPTATTYVVSYSDLELGGYAGLTAGLRVFLDDAAPGQVTQAAPVAPGTLLQQIGIARNATTIVIQTLFDFTVN